MAREAVIVDAVRSPLTKGRPNGKLAGVHPVDLLANTFDALVRRTGVDPATIDDVIAGCVTQIGDQAGDIARIASLAAGFPETVPGTTVDRRCGSSQQALHFAAQGVLAGAYDVVVAGGVESMSRVPMGAAYLGADPGAPATRGSRYQARYPEGMVNQGVSAELIASRWGLSRTELDTFAARSHERALAAQLAGIFEREIAPIDAPPGGEVGGDLVTITADDGIRPGTTAETLAGLKPSFLDPVIEARFPEIEWKVTAGNSSQITDGASAVLVTSRERAEALGLPMRARFVAFDVLGDNPLLMLTAVIPATQRVLEKAGLTVDDVDAFEVNEAFASVVGAWLKDTGADPDRVNVHGGAIALGHPLGGSGGRLMTSLLSVLDARNGRFGLEVMCEGGGQANATVIERLT